MSIQIIADSCCDTTPEIRAQLGIELVPLLLRVPGYAELRDEVGIDTAKLVNMMSQSNEPTRTACPSPEDYAEKMRLSDESIVITLSNKLSGSNGAAQIARDMVLAENPARKVHVIDSQSAAAGELLIAIFIDRLRKAGETFDDVVAKAEQFRNKMRTFFVLENLSNLVKNGRMSKVKGIVASVLSIHPILADNRRGEIESLHTVRGLQNSLSRLVDSIREHLAGCPAKSTNVVISQCLCPERANDIARQIAKGCPAVEDVLVVPTSGLSTVYANKGGVVVAFQPA